MRKVNMEMEKESDTSEQQGDAEPLVHLEAGTINPEQLEELKTRAAKADEHWDFGTVAGQGNAADCERVAAAGAAPAAGRGQR